MAKIYRVLQVTTESVSLRKCPYDNWFANKAYFSAITVTNISQIKKSTGPKLRQRHPMYTPFTFTFTFTLLLQQLEFVRHSTCVSKVEPHRPMLNNKMSSPFGSPISSAKRWNVDRGTTISRRQNLVCASRINAPYSLRQRCMPTEHDDRYSCTLTSDE